jgi:hypothetical protein
MTRRAVKTIDDIYDDLTADSLNSQSYYVEQPTFEQFSYIHEKMVREFGHNALLGSWIVNDIEDGPDDTTTDQLQARWKSIATWYDVATYMEDWILRQIEVSGVDTAPNE